MSPEHIDGLLEHITPTSGVRVGVDVVSTNEVARSIQRFGNRFTERIYTRHELESCRGAPATVAASLAARFAAKEATIKVLEPDEARPDWRCIEVVRAPSGACSLELRDRAADLAARAGITAIAVSLSHEEDIAVATVVALVDKEQA